MGGWVINGEFNVCMGGRGENCEQHSTTGYVHSLTRGDVGGSAQHMGPPTAAQCAGSQAEARRYVFFFSIIFVALRLS